MAHKKGVGSSRNGRDSNPQYLGVKHYGGELVIAGNIIVPPARAPSSTRARTSVSATTTPSSRWWMAW